MVWCQEHCPPPLFYKWIPGAQPPSAYTLSGPVLDCQVSAAETQVKELVNRKIGTGQCDRWKDVT